MVQTQNSSLQLNDAVGQADAIIIGAGAGLSTSAGFTYSGERFWKYFSDFAKKYDFKDMYSGGFYPYETLEEHWAYWSRYIYINRYIDASKSVCEFLDLHAEVFERIVFNVFKDEDLELYEKNLI